MTYAIVVSCLDYAADLRILRIRYAIVVSFLDYAANLRVYDAE